MTTHSEQNYQQRILNVLIYIQNHLDRELSLEELAQVAFFSPYHFHRIFTAYTGETIKSYVRRLRLERASKDLLFTDLSIVQTAERAGYETQQSFHRAFKEVFQVTPTEFREKRETLLTPALMQKKYPDAITPDVTIISVESFSVAFVRHVGDYEEIMQAWLLLANEVGLNTLLSDDIKKISIPYDTKDITPVDKIRYDACVALEKLPQVKANGKVGVQTIRGGKYAKITHNGPIEKIDTTYEMLFGVWLPQSRFEPDDFPNFMHHRSTPFVTDPLLLETDIYLPIR